MRNPKELQAPGRKLATRVLHSASSVDPRTGASSIPLYQASTFHHTSLEDPPQYDYTRSGNPTRQALEDTIAELEGGTRGFAFASGMAAISTAFMLLSQGDHVLCSEDVYGGTYRLLATILGRMGIETTFVDLTDLDRLEAARRPNTRAVFIETPSNPTLKITDIAASGEVGPEARHPLAAGQHLHDALPPAAARAGHRHRAPQRDQVPLRPQRCAGGARGGGRREAGPASSSTCRTRWAACWACRTRGC